MTALLLEAVSGLVFAVVLMGLCGWLLEGLRSWCSPQRRLLRERRRYARRTARAMRQMTAIRARTARRMDEVERWWPR